MGRGSAYFLHDDPAAYHVFIYAPVEEKIRRERLAGRDGPTAARLVETVDGERAAFIWRYFGKVWPDPHLYHAMINSKIGDERVVDVILEGVAALPRA